MSARFRVELTVGSHAFTVTDADAPSLPGVEDGLTFGWKLRDSGIPGIAHPAPMTAKFTLVARAASTFADLDYAQPVAIKVWTHGRSGGTPEFAFYGRVSDLDADTSRAGQTAWKVTAVDYLADLGVGVGASTDWPQENVEQRLPRIVSEAGHALRVVGGTGQAIAAKAAGMANGLELVQKTCEFYVFGSGGYPNITGVVTPYADANGHVTVTASGASGDYVLEGVPLAPSWTATAPPPLRLQVVGGIVQVAAVADPAAGAIDACYVERAASWYRDRSDAFTEARVTSAGVTTYVTTYLNAGKPLVLFTLDTDLVNGDQLGYWAIGGSDQGWNPVGKWNIDAFTWLLGRDPSLDAAAPRQLMPNHGDLSTPTTYYRWAWLTRPLALFGIDAACNVPGRTVADPSGARVGYYAGQPVGAQLTIAGGEVALEVAMNHNVPRVYEWDQGSAGTPMYDAWALLVHWDRFASAPLTGTTWQQLDPADTWADYHLVRTP